MDKLEQVKLIVQEWLDKQGHNRCWYYPDLFNRLAHTLDIRPGPIVHPPRGEFEKGCERFQDEEYQNES